MTGEILINSSWELRQCGDSIALLRPYWKEFDYRQSLQSGASAGLCMHTVICDLSFVFSERDSGLFQAACHSIPEAICDEAAFPKPTS